MMHAGRLGHSDRLDGIYALLADGAEHSTAAVARAGRTFAVSPSISELRANGAVIDCRREYNRRTQRLIYFYKMLSPAPEAKAKAA